MKKRNKIIQSAILLAAAVLIFLLESPRNFLDNKTEEIFSIIRGELRPDSNIVIIHISSEDLGNIGPWPIKRSYYALLIKSLTKYDVKKIGLEIFLSAKFSTQAIYEEIMLRHKEAIKKGDDFYTDPETGLTVFTSLFLLEKGYCCGSGCRHCPYKNV